jgi:alanyl-tRNA synthetase
MQQHTGQHILSQSLLRIGKFNTVSVHFGEIYTAIETDTEAIPEESIWEVENLANRIVTENTEVRIQWVDPAEVEKYHIRRPPPDVKKVRIVQVGDFDASACGGLHVSRTGEIGLIKIIGQEKIRGRIRIQAKIGKRAYADYHEKSSIVQEVSQLLTCGEDTMIRRVTDLDEQLREANRTIGRLQSELISYDVNQLIKSSPMIKGVLFIHKIFKNEDNKILKIFLEQVLTEANRVALAVNCMEGRRTWIAGDTVKVPFDLRALLNPILSKIDARGGGNEHLMQGGGKNCAGINDFIHQFTVNLEKEL